MNIPLPFHRQLQQTISAALHDEREARSVTLLLFERMADLPVAQVLSGADESLSADTKAMLQQAADRVAQGEPVQYVVGWEWFCGLQIGVAPGVLIPRPETEELVNRAALMLRHAGSSPAVLDIGTGSGCIALALKHIVPQARVEAWDIDTDALTIAKRNAAALDLDVHFAQQDILQFAQQSDSAQMFQLIVSNPPYICRSEAAEMERQVLEHEPHRALFVDDDDPLLFYRAIARAAQQLLVPGGRLMVEINRRYGSDVAALFHQHGLTDITVRRDEFDNERFVCASRFSRGEPTYNSPVPCVFSREETIPQLA